jgi:hypothetical protein
MITATSRPILFVITLLAAPSVTRAGFMVGEGALEKPGGGMPVDVNILGVGPGYFTMDHNGTSDVGDQPWSYKGATGTLNVGNFGVSKTKHLWLGHLISQTHSA